jgi:hypothetical protein
MPIRHVRHLRSALRRRALVFASLAAVALPAVALPGVACTRSPVAPRVTGTTRVLFIGNSLTYVHDVPALVQAIARQVNDTGLVTASVAFPDFALEDHWHEGTAGRALTGQGWEFVVMQQGPSSLPANREHLAHWSRTFAPSIRAAGAAPVLYQVWPQISRRADAPAVLVSYANAAREVGGRLAAAGAAWDSVLAMGDPLPVYSSDGLHASAYGAWLAAVVVYATLRELDPVSLPAALPAGVAAPPLSPDRVRVVLLRASQAMAGARR